MDETDLEETGARGRILDQVLRLPELAIRSGCQGIVTSARETDQVQRHLSHKFANVNPSIRPTSADHGDQRRDVTAPESIAPGATHIVVERPNTEAAT